jgi:general secretion pathway protein G
LITDHLRVKSETAGMRNGNSRFTVMIVTAIVVILIATAIQHYQKSPVRAKESVLKNNLFTIRVVIDEYSYDKQKAPQSLQDLVRQGYLREVPRDPITGNNKSWRIINDAPQATGSADFGILDIRSGSDKTSLGGRPYSDWD